MTLKSDLLKELVNKKILITGGSGFFGKNLCEYLVKLNLDYHLNLKIYSLSRNEVKQENIVFIKQDITCELTFKENIDYVIHAATPVVNDQSTPEELLSIIINGTQNIAKWARDNHCKRFLNISSGAVYGTQPFDLELMEESFLEEVIFYDPKNAYATGKRVAELLIDKIFRASNVEYSTVRGYAFSGKYLAFDQHFAIGNFVRDALETKKINIKGDGLAVRSYMDSDDLCVWVLTILLKGKKGEAYNLGSDQGLTIKDLALKVSTFVEGSTVTVQNSGNPNMKSNRYVPSIKKAKNELGLELSVSLDDSINKMIKIYKKQIGLNHE